MSIESVMPSNHVILCCPLLFLLSIFPSIRVFSNKSVLRIRWPKYWSMFQHQSSKEYSGLISFRIDWFDLLAVQGSQLISKVFHGWVMYVKWSEVKWKLLSRVQMNNAICGRINRPRDYHTKWSKPDRKRQISHDIAYMWNFKKWYKWSYLQNRN